LAQGTTPPGSRPQGCRHSSGDAARADCEGGTIQLGNFFRDQPEGLIPGGFEYQEITPIESENGVDPFALG